MADQKMSFEGLIYYGTVGTTAPVPGGRIPETRDMSFTTDTDRGDTTVREVDDSGNPLIPIETGNVTRLKWQFDFQTLNVPGNAIIAALLAAAFTGAPIAFRSKDYVAGKGFDGDVTLTVKHSQSLGGEQTLDFSAKPTRAGGRRAQFYI